MTPEAALGRVLAAPVTAAVSLPPWDNSAMDGFAIRAADVAAATEDAPVRLTVVGESRAGGAPDARVMPETAIRIATGAPLPQGADAVVPVEDTTPLDEQGGAGPRGRQVLGPVPAATLVHARVRHGQRDPDARQRRPGGRRHRPARRPRDARRRGARVRGRRRHGRRAPPPDRRGPRHGRRGARPRHGPRTGRDPRCERPRAARARPRRRRGPAGPRDRGGHARGRRGAAPARASPRRTSSSCRAASRSVRTTSSGSRSTTSGT